MAADRAGLHQLRQCMEHIIFFLAQAEGKEELTRSVSSDEEPREGAMRRRISPVRRLARLALSLRLHLRVRALAKTARLARRRVVTLFIYHAWKRRLDRSRSSTRRTKSRREPRLIILSRPSRPHHNNHSHPHTAPVANPERRKNTITVPHDSASLFSTTFGAAIIAALEYHPFVKPSAAVKRTHGASDEDNAWTPAARVVAKNAGTNNTLAPHIIAKTRGRLPSHSPADGIRPGRALPATSAALNTKMSATGYQSPSASLATSSASTPGKMESVTAYTHATEKACGRISRSMARTSARVARHSGCAIRPLGVASRRRFGRREGSPTRIRTRLRPPHAPRAMVLVHARSF